MQYYYIMVKASHGREAEGTQKPVVGSQLEHCHHGGSVCENVTAEIASHVYI